MTNVYRTIYIDKDEQSFVGEEWIADTEEQYNTALDLEHKVFEEIPVIEKIVIMKPIETLLKGEVR
jgi:hypothetical protein